MASYSSSNVLATPPDELARPGDFRHFRCFRLGRFSSSPDRFAARQERTPRYISLERRPGSPNIHVGRPCEHLKLSGKVSKLDKYEKLAAELCADAELSLIHI